MSSWWFGHKTMDSSQFENRFSNEDSLAYLDSIVGDPQSEESTALLDRVRGVLDRLPPREADFVDLYYFKQINQTGIADIFRVSQPTVCYRLQRAASRILYLVNLPDLDMDEFNQLLEKYLPDPTDQAIMRHMFETTCQSEAAKRLGVTQGFVRHRFLRSIERFRSIPEMGHVVKLFDGISTNLNILREVQRPNWETRITRIIN